MEIRGDAGVIPRSGIYACASRNEAQIESPNIASKKSGRRQLFSCSNRSSIYHRGCRRDVQENIVVGGVESNAISTPNDCLVACHAKNVRTPSKSDIRLEVFVVIRNFRNCGDGGG